MQVKKVYRDIPALHDHRNIFIVFEDAGQIIEKRLFMSGCALATLKPEQIKNEWYWKAVQATKEVINSDLPFEMPKGYMKIAEFIEDECK